jgi:hypothetical protein
MIHEAPRGFTGLHGGFTGLHGGLIKHEKVTKNKIQTALRVVVCCVKMEFVPEYDAKIGEEFDDDEVIFFLRQYAIREEYEVTVFDILTHCGDDIADRDPEIFDYLLVQSCKHNHLYIFYLLLDSNRIDVEKWLNGDQQQVIKQIIKYKKVHLDKHTEILIENMHSKIKTKRQYKRCLEHAYKNGNNRVVKKLFEQHFDKFVNELNLEDMLYNACQNGHVEIAKLILSKQKCNNLCPCIRIAEKFGHLAARAVVKSEYNRRRRKLIMTNKLVKKS